MSSVTPRPRVDVLARAGRLVPIPFAFAALSAMAAAAPVSAQDLTYFTTTTLEVSAALGRALSSALNVEDPIAQLVCFKGSRIRIDGDEASSILDWRSGVQTFLDHSDRTFLRMDFSQMAEAMGEARPRHDPAAWTSAAVTRAVHPTWRKDDLGGYAAEELILVVELKPESSGGTQGPLPAAALVTQLWLSSEFPEYRLRQEMAPEALAQYRRIGRPGGLAQAVSALSRANVLLASGWEESMTALEELEGTVLGSVTHFVVLPPGAALDRAEVFATAAEEVEEVPGRAQGAARPTRQAVVMRVRTGISGVSTDVVAESTFAVPPSYKPKGTPDAE